MKHSTYGRGRGRKVHGEMSKLEMAFTEVLAAQLLAGEILEWAYEPETLKLAPRTTYTPDFRVMLPDGAIRFIEVKGFWEQQARIKLKVAAELHPYRFVAVTRKAKKDGGGWEYEVFGRET